MSSSYLVFCSVSVSLQWLLWLTIRLDSSKVASWIFWRNGLNSSEFRIMGFHRSCWLELLKTRSPRKRLHQELDCTLQRTLHVTKARMALLEQLFQMNAQQSLLFVCYASLKTVHICRTPMHSSSTDTTPKTQCALLPCTHAQGAFQPHHCIRLNAQFRSDSCWWATFLHAWNGVSLLGCQTSMINFLTDALGHFGCRAQWNDNWLQLQWPQSYQKHELQLKQKSTLR